MEKLRRDERRVNLKRGLIVPLFLLVVILLWSAISIGKEIDVSRRICLNLGGIPEYRLIDGTRVDCLTKDKAMEFEFARKWYEGLSQALYYGAKTKRKPALVIIIKDPKEMIYINRVKFLIDYWQLPVSLFYTGLDSEGVFPIESDE